MRATFFLGVPWLDTALVFWAEPFGCCVGANPIDKEEKTSLRDNAKAPSSRSTPKVAVIAPREVSLATYLAGLRDDGFRMFGFPHAEREGYFMFARTPSSRSTPKGSFIAPRDIWKCRGYDLHSGRYTTSDRDVANELAMTPPEY